MITIERTINVFAWPSFWSLVKAKLQVKVSQVCGGLFFGKVLVSKQVAQQSPAARDLRRATIHCFAVGDEKAPYSLLSVQAGGIRTAITDRF